MLGRLGRHGDDGNRDLVARRDLAQLPDVENRHARARFLSDLARERVEQRRNLKAFLLKPGIVGERETEVAGAEDGDLEPAIEAENLPQVLLEILDVVADAAHAELAEVRQVFANLRGVEMKLMREGLRRNGLHAVRIERVETSQIDGEPVGGELRDLIAELLALDRQFHKDFIAVPSGIGTIEQLAHENACAPSVVLVSRPRGIERRGAARPGRAAARRRRRRRCSPIPGFTRDSSSSCAAIS